jgi:hypothetical protein
MWVFRPAAGWHRRKATLVQAVKYAHPEPKSDLSKLCGGAGADAVDRAAALSSPVFRESAVFHRPSSYLELEPNTELRVSGAVQRAGHLPKVNVSKTR